MSNDNKPAAAQEAVAYIVTPFRTAHDGSYENGPDELCFAEDASEYVRQTGLPLYAAPVAAAPVDLDAHGLRALDNCINDLSRLIELADDFALDEMHVQSLLTAIESMELRKVASTPAAPGTDLAQFKDLIGFAAWSAINLPEIDPRRDFIRQASELLALIDASPKGGSELPVEPKIWGTQKPGSMPKLFGAHHIAELNWYPDEGHDLVCMQVIERVQATSAEVGS
ncbi:MAG: hypothetical protein ACN6O2_06625 [Stenotrophomonas sp.]